MCQQNVRLGTDYWKYTTRPAAIQPFSPGLPSFLYCLVVSRFRVGRCQKARVDRNRRRPMKPNQRNLGESHRRDDRLEPLVFFPHPREEPIGLRPRHAIGSRSQGGCQRFGVIDRHSKTPLRRIPDILRRVSMPRPEANISTPAMLSTVDRDGPIVASLHGTNERVDGFKNTQRRVRIFLHQLNNTRTSTGRLVSHRT